MSTSLGNVGCGPGRTELSGGWRLAWPWKSKAYFLVTFSLKQLQGHCCTMSTRDLCCQLTKQLLMFCHVCFFVFALCACMCVWLYVHTHTRKDPHCFILSCEHAADVRPFTLNASPSVSGTKCSFPGSPFSYQIFDFPIHYVCYCNSKLFF